MDRPGEPPPPRSPPRPGRGGLVVSARELPYDWGRRAVNRASLFHSSPFHESHGIRFRDGFENRRAAIARLFDRRDTGGRKDRQGN